MERYQYTEDNKLHTRYSELKNCTPGSVAKTVERRRLEINETNPYTEFGTLRHEVFASFIEKHGKLPGAVISPTVYATAGDKKITYSGDHPKRLELEVDRDCIEKSYAVEVWENVVIHMTADLHNTTWVVDFKTTTKGVVNYRSDKQVVFYAWFLNKLGHNITTGYYICELWDRDRTQIQGYEVLERPITPGDIAEVEAWAKQRVTTLYQELTKGN